MSKDIYIGETSIQFGNSGYINQPKEIIDYIKSQHKEIDRLNNIINELEKWLSYEWYEMSKDINPEEVLDKLKELKEKNND